MPVGGAETGVRRWGPGMAGAVAVGAALAVSEFLAAIVHGVPSLVTSVGSLVVPVVPPWLEDWAIATFGTDDKAVLAVGTVVLTMAVGAWAGVAGLRDRGRGLTMVLVLATVGLFAAALQPLVRLLPTLAVVAVAAAAGWGVLTGAWRVLDGVPRRNTVSYGAPAHDDRAGHAASVSDPAAPAAVPPGDPRNPPVDRRRFLALVGGAGVAAGAIAVGARTLQPGDAASLASEVVLPRPVSGLPPPPTAASFDVSGITPLHVPNDRFFRIDTALSVPRVDPARWRLRVHGMVDRELELTFDDLLARTFVEQDVTIACVSNEVGGNLIGNARWLGTSLADLLDEAGPDPAATQVVGRSIDGWTAGFPTNIVTGRRDSLIAVGMNGEPLPPRHGFPARLIVPGLFGYVSATKWLTEIELTTWEAFDAYWVPRGWAKEGPIKTQSRIDVPAPGARLDPGTNVIAGVAWAPTRGVGRVEVRVDDGPWTTADLSEPLGDATWVQWRAEVRLEPGSRRLQVRATDGAGRTQSEERVDPRPDGAEGWHTIHVFA
jgi:DMSO/TMAO reductase YedYZ molybdopterin-dependent catalytic subunit